MFEFSVAKKTYLKLLNDILITILIQKHHARYKARWGETLEPTCSYYLKISIFAGITPCLHFTPKLRTGTKWTISP